MDTNNPKSTIYSENEFLVPKKQKTYICIDLKSFYASVECCLRNLDPLTTNLVVADESRSDKTICLAVSPSLKAYGIPGRPRLFEVKQKVAEIKQRTGKTIEFITAIPQMKKYIEWSSRIYNVYLRFISADSIWVYSIDEVFIDATSYLELYHLTPRELATKLVHEVYKETGITATAGVGIGNPYLAKVAMDIVAKHIDPDEYGVRVAELDEISYRRNLWNHKPLTSFWRVGPGIARKLESLGITTMGQLAKYSLLKCYYDPNSYKADYLYNGSSISGEDKLFQIFGIDAELLIDHAWGKESCTMENIKAYRPSTNSLSSGQVLSHAYTREKALVVMREMVEQLVLDIVEKHLVTNQVVIYVGFDKDLRPGAPGMDNGTYSGEMKKDHYGRMIPKPANGTQRFDHYTSSTKELLEAAISVYNRIYTNPSLMARRLNVVFANLIPESQAAEEESVAQLDLFADHAAEEAEKKAREKEKKIQQAMLAIKGKYGKNAILTGTNYQDGATGRERNNQVGGHRG